MKTGVPVKSFAQSSFISKIYRLEQTVQKCLDGTPESVPNWQPRGSNKFAHEKSLASTLAV